MVYGCESSGIGASKSEAREFFCEGEEGGIQSRHDDGKWMAAMRGLRIGFLQSQGCACRPPCMGLAHQFTYASAATVVFHISNIYHRSGV